MKVSSFIDHMIQDGGDHNISLRLEDVKDILKEGDLALLGSAKGSNIDEMVGSLADSVTDGYIRAKGCLLHFAMLDSYPLESIKKIVNDMERRLRLDSEDLLPLYFGTFSNDKMAENEILIRALVSI